MFSWWLSLFGSDLFAYTIVLVEHVTYNFRVKVNPEDGGSMLLQNGDKHQQGYSVSLTPSQSEQKLGCKITFKEVDI
jgi:hypothetical protein